MALDQQKNSFIENQQRERERMRMDRLSLQSQKTQDCSVCDARSGCPGCGYGPMPYLPVMPYPYPGHQAPPQEIPETRQVQEAPQPKAASPKKPKPQMRDSA